MLPPVTLNPSFSITRANHVVLTARDLEKSRHLYEFVIGLRVDVPYRGETLHSADAVGDLKDLT
jgi:catechol 2,3-dioxygenase-like lactoylglutathione lyase family enzyme